MILDKFKLTDRVSIITGAASGIGKELAKEFAEAGSHIVVADINYEGARKACEEIRQKGVQALPVRVDITDERQVDEMVKHVTDQFGRIDVLVNNAGIGARIEIEPESVIVRG